MALTSISKPSPFFARSLPKAEQAEWLPWLTNQFLIFWLDAAGERYSVHDQAAFASP